MIILGALWGAHVPSSVNHRILSLFILLFLYPKKNNSPTWNLQLATYLFRLHPNWRVGEFPMGGPSSLKIHPHLSTQGSFLATFGACRLDGRLWIFVISDPTRICLDLEFGVESKESWTRSGGWKISELRGRMRYWKTHLYRNICIYIYKNYRYIYIYTYTIQAVQTGRWQWWDEVNVEKKRESRSSRDGLTHLLGSKLRMLNAMPPGRLHYKITNSWYTAWCQSDEYSNS